MKKQYRRRRAESSGSDEDRDEEGQMAHRERPPSKVPREQGDSRGRHNSSSHTLESANRSRYSAGSSSRREEEERRGRKDRDSNYADEDDGRRRRDGREVIVVTAPARSSLGPGRGRDSGLSYSSLAAGGSRDRERARERDLAQEREGRAAAAGRDSRRSGTTTGADRYDSRADRDRESSRRGESRGHSDYARPRSRERDRDRDRSRDRERDRSRDREVERDGAGGERGGTRRGDDAGESGREAAGSKSKGIFSYIASNNAVNCNGGGGAESSPVRPERNGDPAHGAGAGAGGGGGGGVGGARALRPNSAALSSIIRGDRRANIRMDREQFDGAQKRLRKLDPEGNEIKDTFSTGCRPDLTGKKDHPFVCNVCPLSFPMATQLSDHFERSHGIFRHPSLITPNKSLSVGLAQDVHNAS